MNTNFLQVGKVHCFFCHQDMKHEYFLDHLRNDHANDKIGPSCEKCEPQKVIHGGANVL